MIVKDVEVKVEGLTDVSAAEISHYIDYVNDNTVGTVKSLDITTASDGEVALSYELKPQKFERIRRITGYLVGTTDRWNNAKRSEEHDRVKHTRECA
ncbi:MAG: hypothetical protein IJ849_02470 [Selenomonadaceae bacterium]|nr:hypothetical protein [Selenomonadaceae bacterium]